MTEKTRTQTPPPARRLGPGTAMRSTEAHPMRHPSIVITILVMLFGCQENSSHVDNCTKYLKATLKSPSTLEIVSTHVRQGDGFPIVDVVYDASNSFGVMLRGKFNCSYNPEGRVEDVGAFIEAIRISAQAANEALEERKNRLEAFEGYEGPIRPGSIMINDEEILTTAELEALDKKVASLYPD